MSTLTAHVPIFCLCAAARSYAAPSTFRPGLQGTGDRRAPSPVEDPAAQCHMQASRAGDSQAVGRDAFEVPEIPSRAP